MASWVLGKSDFNENPVVSLDFDFDLEFVNSKKHRTAQSSIFDDEVDRKIQQLLDIFNRN